MGLRKQVVGPNDPVVDLVLAQLRPGLFDKYLYVGITRAATYLGITCHDSLPAELATLRSHLGADWSSTG